MPTECTISPFDLTHTFECGQCFRWNKNDDGSYTGIAFGKVLTISQKGDKFIFDQDISLWEKYFDLETDYAQIQKKLSHNNPVMEKVIPFGNGIRILKQDLFETVISFLISQNNHIPRIKSIIEKLCDAFGEEIDYGGKTYHAFPTPEALASLTLDQLAFLKAGYRDKYILDASKKFLNNEINTELLYNAPLDLARKELFKITGIGPKVADCILLFGASRTNVFPTDVWMKRVLSDTYNMKNLTPTEINRFAEENFGELAGYAQQYLFYNARSGA